MDNRNIKKISHFERIAHSATDWIGSTSSIIAHSIVFVAVFALYVFGIKVDTILLALTTAVSLEAIYLAIFIQMTVNRSRANIRAVRDDIEEIEKDIDNVQEGIEEIEKDVDEIQEDIEEIEKDEKESDEREIREEEAIRSIQSTLKKLMEDIDNIKS